MSNITLKIKKLASKGYILVFGGILLFGGGVTALYLGGFGTSSSVDLGSGLVGHWKMDEASSDWFEGFESGNLDDWTVYDTNFEIKTGNVFEGTYSAGIETTATDQIKLSETFPDELAGGKRIPSFEYRWYDKSAGRGGGISFKDSDGDEILGVGSDNPEWFVIDAGGSAGTGEGGAYETWTHFQVEFDWVNGTYTLIGEDAAGNTDTHSGTLKKNTNIESIAVQSTDPNARANGWSANSYQYIWYDNFHFTHSSVKDITPNANHGVVNGATTSQDRNGNSDSAHSLDGTDDHIDLGDRQEFEFAESQSFSVAFWMKPTDVANNSGPLSKHYGIQSNKTPWYLFRYKDTTTSNDINWMVRKNSGEETQISAGMNLINGWHHVVGIYDGSVDELRLYVDGELRNTATGVPIAAYGTNDGVLEIGSHSSTYFPGLMDEVRIYERALTSKEISQLHDSYNPGVQVSNSQKSLKGHWKMDGNAKDSTPQRNHGTVNGSILTTDRHNQADSSYEFDGIDDYINRNSYSEVNYAESYTVSAWVNPYTFTNENSNCGDQRAYIVSQSGGSLSDTWELRTDSGSRFAFRRQGSSGSVLVSSNGYATNQWYHLAAVYDKGAEQLQLLVNGEIVDTADVSGMDLGNPSGNPLRIGWDSQNCASPYFEGKIDDVRIYERALSENEIHNMHDSYNPTLQMSDLQKGMVGDWALDGHSKDSTPYRNHGTLGGSPTPTTDRKGGADSAYSFDGANDYIDAGDIDGDFNPMTLSLWFNAIDVSSSGQRIAIKEQSGSQGWALSLGDPGANRLRFYTRELSAVSLDTNSIISANTWYHAVAVWDSSNGVKQIWVDGEKVAETSGITGSQADTNASFGIGARPDSTGHFNGKIDGVRLYDRVLSGEEIKALHDTYR